MKKLINKINRKGAVFWGMTLMVTAMMLSVSVPVLAWGDMQTQAEGAIGPIVGVVFGALQMLGAAVAVFGAIQFAFAFKNDDADGKGKGMRAFLAGAMGFAVGAIGRGVVGGADFTELI